MKKIFNKEFLIGLSVIVAIVILIFGIDFLKGINLFTPANFYYATYDNVAGLELSAPVNIDGYKVGQVREIKFDYEKPGKIEVVLALDKKLRLPEDTRAVIGSSLLGGSYIDLKYGKSSKMIEVGGHVPTDVTSDLMASLSSEVMPAVNGILPKVDSLLISLNRLACDPSLLKSLSRLDGITSDVLKLTGGLSSTFSREVPPIMSNARKATETIDSITADLYVLSAQLKAIPLANTVDNVNDLTSQLSKFSTQLNDRKSTLGRIMNDDELYTQLNKVTSDVDSLIVDIKKNPKRYINIKLL